MKWFDIVLIVIIAAYFVYAVLSARKHKCSGNCGSCSGCANKCIKTTPE